MEQSAYMSNGNDKIHCVTCSLYYSTRTTIATERMDKQQVQSEIHYAGYKCGRKDDVQISSSNNELIVAYDKIYRFDTKETA